MAYNPTTWGSNDVITKDRLNKMEQGIVSASKLSGTDIDADKDWNGKSITNMNALTMTVAAPDALIVIYPSDTVIAESPDPKTTSTEDWIALKSATVVHSGMIRVRWTHARSGDFGGSYTRVAVSGRYSAESVLYAYQGPVTVTRDVLVRAGETVSIEGNRGSSVSTTTTVSAAQFLGSAGVVPYSTRTPTVTITLD